MTDRFDDWNGAPQSARITTVARYLQAYTDPEAGVVELENRPIASSAKHPWGFDRDPYVYVRLKLANREPSFQGIDTTSLA